MPAALSRYGKLMKSNDAVTPLSFSTKAVLDAFLNTPGEEPMPGWNYNRDLAAALRAVADEVQSLPLSTDYIFWDSGHEVGIIRAVDKLLAIADELENK